MEGDRAVNAQNGAHTVRLLRWYRQGHALEASLAGRSRLASLPQRAALRALRWRYVRACRSLGGFLPFSARIGERLELRHSLHGVFVSKDAVIGDDCVVLQHVTLGSDYDTGGAQAGAPVVGNGVFFGTGATVIGRVRIGDGARIGANATVVDDVPAGATVVGPKASILRKVPA